MSARDHLYTPDGDQQHRDWLSLIEVSGPFLSIPVLRTTWPTLDAIDKPTLDELRLRQSTWLDSPDSGQQDWIEYVLCDLLGWGDALHWHDGESLSGFTVEVPEHETRLTPSFALAEPGEDPKPATTRLFGTVCLPGAPPTARVKSDAWAATPADRLARMCRHHGVELGLVTDGRWWTLVRAPKNKVTTTATFDAASWPEAAERYVLRAFVSLLGRGRFFGVPDDEALPALLEKSEDTQEEITEALGVQVRQAVELLVAAFGRADTKARERGEQGLQSVAAHEVYRVAVSIMMRIVFLLFAEERRLLPSDNELYVTSYSVGRLAAQLEEEAVAGSEDELENSFRRWHRLLALFRAVYQGIEHPRLEMHAHDGSLFDPEQFPWLPLTIDDRTVLHMLRAVQYVEIGTGKARERRKLSFRELDVEQIGYVYEGLLSYGALRAADVVVSLIGKRGEEHEVSLSDLEEKRARAQDTSELAENLSQEQKDSGIGSPRKLEKLLAPLDGTEREQARQKLLAATRGDNELTEQLLPFYRIIRHDLRELPVVILPGELYVTESPLRKNTGTHYTPRKLAEQIVEGALEPLVYRVGPLQTADTSKWEPKSSDEILALKVADIAMGSAAFLVAAARYLAGHLIEAATREGADWVKATSKGADALSEDEDPVVIRARRMIIEHCLYGVDINPMATEMAKLSLWLVSMDPERPFTFLDDRLVTGDSLLGITSLDQLRYMHMDPKEGRKIHENALDDVTAGVRSLVGEVANDRRELAEIDGSTLDGLARKRSLLEDTKLKTSRARVLADLTVGAALHHSKHGERGLHNGSVSAAEFARHIQDAEPRAHEQARLWLTTDLPSGGFVRQPLHWPVTFPEVFENGGFDAVVGNPPFLGGTKLRGPLGMSYGEYLAECIANGVRAGGRCDLVAYFALRAATLLNRRGQAGLIATSTLARGDTREVGLDQLVRSGVTIRQSIKSKPWPSKFAAVEYCAVWTSHAPLANDARRFVDNSPVDGITSSLDAASRTTGHPYRLLANAGLTYQGFKLDGIGFTMEIDEAQALINNDSRNRNVLLPYLSGRDINARSDGSPGRWVINFHDWSEEQAKTYFECYHRVSRLVKPEREKHNRKGHREYWWHYAEKRPGMLKAIVGLERVIVITLHTKICMPVMVPANQVFSHALGVFATDSCAMLALLSSAQHFWWAKVQGSSIGAGIRYTPSDVFETFPLPNLTDEMRELGDRLDTFRREVMLSRDSGLTKTYNLACDPSCKDDDIEELRRIHRAIDEATIRAYGWEDRIERVVGLDHGFHKAGRETRYTIGPAAQREVLDSLLELNHERYAEEVAQGLHEKKGARRAGKSNSEESLF